MISVIVCTYKREKYLVEAIYSLLKQKTNDAFNYEIIIVDNSIDGTARSVVEQLRNIDSKKVKYYNEKQPGLSNARNAGINQASGDIIAFLDDDAVAEEDWLYELWRVYIEYKDAVCVGGKVEMVIPREVDIKWIPEDFFAYLSILDFGDKLFYAQDHTEYPIGVNISYKREVFNRIGLFDSTLGRKSSSLLSCEDSEFCFRIQKNINDGKIYYNPNAIVKHHILKERLCKEWFLQRLYWQGISEYIFDLKTFGICYVKKRTAKNIIFNLSLLFKKFIFYKIKKDEKLSFYFKGMMFKEFGYVQQFYNHHIFRNKTI